MKPFYTITFCFFYTLTLAQWPNAVEKRLTIDQSSYYYQIKGTQYDEQGNTYVVINQGSFISRSYPYMNTFEKIRFQKLDKKGVALWNIDSTEIIQNKYISLPEKEGGLYIFYSKHDNIKSLEPMFNNKVFCTYIDKNGLKKWNTEILNIDIFGYDTYPVSIYLNPQGGIDLYFGINYTIYYQKLDRVGNKLLAENKEMTKVSYNSNNIFLHKNKFVFVNSQSNTVPPYNTSWLTKRDEMWNDVWGKEVKIPDTEVFNVLFDRYDNAFLLERPRGGGVNLSKLNTNGDIIFSSKKITNNVNISNPYNYFDAQKNLHLYFFLYDNGSLKMTYIKINEQGEILITKELDNISSRIAESINTIPPDVYNYREKLYDFSLNNSGDILLSWMKKVGDLTELYLSRFDSEGNLLWDKDKLIDTDSTIISTTNIPPTDSTYAVFYLTGKFQYPDRYPPFHSSNFYLKKLSKNGNYNELNAKIANKACENGKIELNLEPEGTYENNNQFRVLLSDANGNFANAKEIGASNQVRFSIDNLKEKEGDYQVKVVSTNPAVEMARPMALKIQKAPSFTLQYNETVMKFDSTAIRFYITGTPPYTMKLWDDTEAHVSTNFYEKYVKPTATSEYTIKSFSDANCAATPVSFKITVLEPLSTEWQARDNVKVYPIPASTKLTLEINNTSIENIPLTLYTVSGELIYQKQTTNGTIDLKDISQGVYLLKGNINGKVFTRKILIEK